MVADALPSIYLFVFTDLFIYLFIYSLNASTDPSKPHRVTSFRASDLFQHHAGLVTSANQSNAIVSAVIIIIIMFIYIAHIPE